MIDSISRTVRARSTNRKVWVALEDGRKIGFPAVSFPRLRSAPDEPLAQVRENARGRAQRGEELNEDVSVAGILASRFGAEIMGFRPENHEMKPVACQD